MTGGGAGGRRVALPWAGIGTWPAQGDAAVRLVLTALEEGFRLVDTATGYGNERAVGAALARSGLPRAEVVVVTKFPEELAGQERAVLERSLDDLGVDAVDLWLIHAPPRSPVELLMMWERFVEAQDEGLVREIGVSNFDLETIDALTRASGVTPAVNQVAFGPRWYSTTEEAGHHGRGVRLVGHSPFSENSLSPPVLGTLAASHGCTRAQVVLAWHRAHDVPVVSRATSRLHMRANLDAAAIVLEQAEVAAVDGLGLASG